MRLLTVVALSLLWMGCPSPEPVEDGGTDQPVEENDAGSPPIDSGTVDSGVVDAGVIVITTDVLPNAEANDPYDFQLTADGPGGWEVVNGALPSGLIISLAGRISGRLAPSSAGAHTFTVRVSVGARAGEKALTLTVDRDYSWTDVDPPQGFVTTRALAQSPLDEAVLYASVTDGATGGLYETSDGGASWSEVTTAPFGVSALDLSPMDSGVVLAGTYSDAGTPGIYRSEQGAAGPFVRVLGDAGVDRIIRVPGTAEVYAITRDHSDGGTTVEVQRSVNDGKMWQPRFTGVVNDLAVRPGAGAGQLVVIGTDVFASTNALATAPTSLSLSTLATGKTFSAAAFESATTLLVGTTTGQLYITDNYDPSGVNVTWLPVSGTVPVGTAAIVSITVVPGPGADGPVWYVAAWQEVPAGSGMPGLARSRNRGATWERLDDGLTPSRNIWRFFAGVRPGTGFAATWGGGILRLDD